MPNRLTQESGSKEQTADWMLHLFRDLVEQSTDAFYVVDVATSRFLEINEVAHWQLGYSREELLARRVIDISVTIPDPQAWENYIRQLRQVPYRILEIEQRCRDGTILPVELNVRLVRHGGREYLISVARDITERRQASEKIIEGKNQLEAVLAALGDGLTMQDRNFRILYQNSVHKKRQGDCAGQLCYRAYQQREEVCPGCLLTRCFADGQVHHHETTAIAPDGSTIFMEVSASPVRDAKGNIYAGIETVRDVTQRKLLEQELQKQEKLESVGVLAGGIAHDFNNMLTAIMGNIALARAMAGDSDKPIRTMLAESEKACLRAQNLTKQLLTFSKGGAPITEAVSIEDLIEESASFLLRGSRVRCVTSFPQGLWPAKIDAGQISQVIQNMVKNADQSMSGSGELEIAAANVELADEAMPNLPAGRYLKITIHDNGVGIPPELLDKIFDPYFSTKTTGIGLGLAVCYSIVNNHGGSIMVESEPRVGTTFTILLPASEEEIAGPALPEAAPTAGGHPGKRILVMDDDEMVRDISAKFLEKLGYEVQCACDGREAIDLYRKSMERRTPFAAVILDLTIPGGLGGQETIAELERLDSKVRSVVSSGFSQDPIMANYRQFGFKAVLAKPFRLEDMATVMRQILA